MKHNNLKMRIIRERVSQSWGSNPDGSTPIGGQICMGKDLSLGGGAYQTGCKGGRAGDNLKLAEIHDDPQVFK